MGGSGAASQTEQVCSWLFRTRATWGLLDCVRPSSPSSLLSSLEIFAVLFWEDRGLGQCYMVRLLPWFSHLVGGPSPFQSMQSCLTMGSGNPSARWLQQQQDEVGERKWIKKKIIANSSSQGLMNFGKLSRGGCWTCNKASEVISFLSYVTQALKRGAEAYWECVTSPLVSLWLLSTSRQLFLRAQLM